ncbi:tetratricopeptide repeat protein, partial [bacterium]|nr:tetratricopeptide repeat protein [bacterium]
MPFLRTVIILSFLVSRALFASAPLETIAGKDRQIESGEIHSYLLPLRAGEFVSLLIYETSIDVTAFLYSPEGLRILQVNLNAGIGGQERILFVTPVSGDYRVEITPTLTEIIDPLSFGGPKLRFCSYKIAVESQRQTNETDLFQAAALSEIVFAEANYPETSELQINESIKRLFNAIHWSKQAEDGFFQARALWKLAELYQLLSRSAESIHFANEALQIYEELNLRKGIAETLNSMGAAYENIGEYKKGLKLYEESLQIWKEVGDRHGEALALHNIGLHYYRTGDLGKALDYYDRILPLWEETGDWKAMGNTFSTMGLAYSSLSENQKAISYFSQALPLQRMAGNSRAEALDSLGTNLLSYTELQKAARMYGLALQLRRQIGDRPGEAESLFHIAALKRKQGQLVSALDYIDSCINIVESLRVRVLSQNLRASFFATSREYYELYQNILFELHQTEPAAGYDAQAFHVSERSRARGLMELLAESSLDLTRGVEPSLLQEERAVREELNSRSDRQMRLLSSGDWPEEAIRLGEEIESLNVQYEQIEARIRRTNPHYAEIMKPEPLTMARVQEAILDDKTLLLEFSLGDEKSFVWAVSRSSTKSAELPPRA